MGKQTAIAKREFTVSEKFTNMVVQEFTNAVDAIEMTPYQRRLAQHLFIKIDATLKSMEAKRTGDRQPIVWNNINMTKLAIDAVHRVDLGLDALIPNHIHPIPYWNTKAGKYDLDLRVGYAGKDFYRRGVAVEQPKGIIYELVYSKDKFIPRKRTLNNPVESYEFEITSPFDRGEVSGGFGYLMYEDSSRNQLVIVTEKDFQKSMALAKTKDFWTNNPIEMRYKTLIHRVTDKLQMDPRKVNASFLAVEADDNDEVTEAQMTEEIEEKANQDFLDVVPETGEIVENLPMSEVSFKTSPKTKTKPKRDPASIKTIGDLTKACFEEFGLQPAQVVKELGYGSLGEIAELPKDCYLKIVAVRAEPKEEAEEEPEF